jgi:putative acetyltransferase
VGGARGRSARARCAVTSSTTLNCPSESRGSCLVRLRAETPADYEAIAAVTTAAFGKRQEARLVEAVRASDRFVPELSLVAEAGAEIVGHVLLSYVDLGDRRVLELGPMSVSPANQRRGVGGKLVREALRRADERGEPLVLVLGHPSYYPRFGFRPASALGIEPPDPSLPDEAFMALPLKAYDPALRGRVVLPPAFQAAER